MRELPQSNIPGARPADLPALAIDARFVLANMKSN
jgi:hypothetical protein